MSYRYYICDVFTGRQFGGNPLAVFPNAQGLTDEQMQKIAREFNFSESTFVFAPEHGGEKRVRIFTPSSEVPFAGHPNVGTACLLASIDAIDTSNSDEPIEISFEEEAGDVPITLTKATVDLWRASITAPEPLVISKPLDVNLLADVLSISAADITIKTHAPLTATVGLPFIFVEVNSLAELQKIKVNSMALEQLASLTSNPFIHVYTKSNDEFDIRARMFAPTDGVPEDPATGSANCALAGLLAYFDNADTKDYRYKIAQGVEMGRPSELVAFASKANGIVTATGVAGTSVVVSHGEFLI